MDRHTEIQVNLQNSPVTTGELVKLLLEGRINIALVQEPYTVKTGSKHRIPGLNGMKYVAEEEEKFQASILYNKKNTLALAIPQFMTKNVSVITTSKGGKKFNYASVYIPPSADIHAEIPSIRRVVEGMQGQRICIGGDFNARSTVWFDVRDDARASVFEEWIMESNLGLMNLSGFPPTFQTVNGSSRVDLTLVSEDLESEITDWRVEEDLITSDHRAITFGIMMPRGNQKMTREYMVDISQITEDMLRDDLNQLTASIREKLPNIVQKEEIDEAIKLLQGGIRSCVIRRGTNRRR